MSEFQTLIAELSSIERMNLQQIFVCLRNKDMDGFLSLYREIVITCTSYMDAKENAYHMLFLGMCITLSGSYKVTSNLEAGYGRSDITLQALSTKNINVIIEFKQGDNIDLYILEGGGAVAPTIEKSVVWQPHLHYSICRSLII